MLDRRIFQIVEIDVDSCNNRFGVAPCTAALSLLTPAKCYGTRTTCADAENYSRGTVTLRFCEASYPLKDGNYMPLLKSVGGREQSVNISGYSTDKGGIGGLGARASIKVSFDDMPSRDVLLDPYWQERMSGAAQFSGVGYDPLTRGSFWSKFKARYPNYADRPLRVIHAYLDDAGAIVVVKTRHYVIEDMEGPDLRKGVTITAKDILALADDKKALAPKLSLGRLTSNIDATQTAFTVTNPDEYPLEGVIVVGSEIMTFTRSGATMIVNRGQQGTQANSHSATDTVQLCYHVWRKRGEAVIYELLTEYGNIDPSWIDLAEWEAEFSKWGSKFVLSATICKPTGVTTLISEINNLGVAIWWDEVAQKIRIKLNHPPENTPVVWNDYGNNMSFKQTDHDKDRITRVDYWSVQIDPTRDLAESNFIRGDFVVSVASETPELYGIQRATTIRTRWLNHGADSFLRIITNRLLNRYKVAPRIYTVTVDAKDDPELTDVINLHSHMLRDIHGAEVGMLAQVINRKDEKLGSTVSVELESFQFNQRYASIGPNSLPVYTSATDAQKLRYAFIAPNSGRFADGTDAYRFI